MKRILFTGLLTASIYAYAQDINLICEVTQQGKAGQTEVTYYPNENKLWDTPVTPGMGAGLLYPSDSIPSMHRIMPTTAPNIRQSSIEYCLEDYKKGCTNINRMTGEYIYKRGDGEIVRKGFCKTKSQALSERKF